MKESCCRCVSGVFPLTKDMRSVEVGDSLAAAAALVSCCSCAICSVSSDRSLSDRVDDSGEAFPSLYCSGREYISFPSGSDGVDEGCVFPMVVGKLQTAWRSQLFRFSVAFVMIFVFF